MKTLIITLLFSLNLYSAPKPVLSMKTKQGTYILEKLTQGQGKIWSMAFVDPGNILFTEIEGKIQLLDVKTSEAKVIKNPPVVYEAGQGGLLDIAVDPDFSKNSYVYVTYSKKMGAKQTTAFARSKVDLKEGAFGPWEDLFVALPAQSTSHHYGSRIAFDNEGHVFVSVGERGQAELAQSLSAHMGKVIRLNVDGTIPKDNPFVDTPGAFKEIWSYGHRNPQGLFFDAKTGNLYEMEHGPQGGDEINLIGKGKNYGWPVITFGEQYGGGRIGEGITSREGMEQPLKYYIPSIAPSGLIIFRSDKLSLFKDRFVSGALAFEHLNVVDFKDPGKSCEDRLLESLQERIRSVKEGPDGLLYVSSDSGNIYRIRGN